jgi:hypothetical protein
MGLHAQRVGKYARDELSNSSRVPGGTVGCRLFFVAWPHARLALSCGGG